MRWLVLAVALVGCRDAGPKPPKMSEALPNLPLPPEASFVSQSGGTDALQVTVRSPARADAVAAYYRQVLSTGVWKLVSDATDAEGAVVLLAQQKGPPLWVRIRSDVDGRGSLIDLSGAVMPKADTTPAPHPKPAS